MNGVFLWNFSTLVIVISIFSFSLRVAAVTGISIDRIEECVLRKENTGKSLSKKATGSMFYLHYGDPAVEVFYTLSPADIKRIDYLKDCAKEEDASLFDDGSVNKNGTILVGSNATYLTGIFQKLLPDIHTKILKAAVHGAEGAEWHTFSTAELGIRSVQHLSLDTGLAMKTKEELAEIRASYRPVFVIGDVKPKLNEDEDDEQADEHVEKYIQSQIHTKYTIVVMLSDRSKYHGGNILVRKDTNQDNKSDDGDDGKEEEEEESGPSTSTHTSSTEQPDVDVYAKAADDNTIDVTAAAVATVTAAAKKPRFSALTTKIGRFTPDKGGILVIQSEHEHGIHKVDRGKIEVLVIEMWLFEDASVGTRRASIEEAKPKALIKDEL